MVRRRREVDDQFGPSIESGPLERSAMHPDVFAYGDSHQAVANTYHDCFIARSELASFVEDSVVWEMVFSVLCGNLPVYQYRSSIVQRIRIRIHHRISDEGGDVRYG